MLRFELLRARRRRGSANRDAAADVTARLLGEAAALSEQGRAAEAVALLTRANRERRDARIERRLVELRYEAFAQLEPPASPPTWPENVDDLWPGVRIPAIEPNELTTRTLRSGLCNHGSLIVRGLLPPERIDHLTADIERALDAYDGRQRGERSEWYEPFQHDRISNPRAKRTRGSIMTVESPPALFDVLETFGAIGIDQLLHDYFGEAPAILARKATLRRVSPGKMAGWHQDGAFMGEGIRSINIWIALTDCGRDAPGLEVIGRRVESLLPMGNGAFAEWGIKATDAAAYGGDDIQRPLFAAGDAMLFDHMLVHRTAFAPEMTRDRHALETWLFAPSTYRAMTDHNGDAYTPRDQIPILF